MLRNAEKLRRIQVETANLPKINAQCTQKIETDRDEIVNPSENYINDPPYVQVVVLGNVTQQVKPCSGVG